MKVILYQPSRSDTVSEWHDSDDDMNDKIKLMYGIINDTISSIVTYEYVYQSVLVVVEYTSLK